MGRIAATLAAILALAAPPALAAPEHYDTTALQQAEILASVGGGYDGPQGAYVSRIGQRMAQAAGLGDGCVFTIVDSEVVNAFTAPPGCFVYVTRGLLAIVNSEDELAAVLGHELGHVAADHSRKQQNTEAVAGIAAALVGAATKSRVAGKLAGKVAELGTLSYSRNQEYEADTLALRYLPAAGYSADGLGRVLQALQREDVFSRGDRRGDAPVWASTHPLTSDRIVRAEQQALQAPQVGGEVGRAEFLAALDGLPYGGAGGQGFVRGPTFVQPTLKIAFDAPPGFTLAGAGDAVRITGPGDLRADFVSGGVVRGSLEDYAYGVMRGLVGDAGVRVGRVQRVTINGFEAFVLPVSGTAGGRPVEVTVFAYAVGQRACHFVTVAPAGGSGAFDPMVGSFRRLGEREAPRGGGRRIAVTTVRAGDTLQSLGGRMAPERDAMGRFLMLNGLSPGQPLDPGQKVKLVLDGRR
jgi:predicted Zn-dependent protease